MDKLRSDNIKLYEKIKFVQTYPVDFLSLFSKRKHLISFSSRRQIVDKMNQSIDILVVMMHH